MVHENNVVGVEEHVEEPIAINNGNVTITGWKMWKRLCKDDSLKDKVETLRLRVSDEEKGEPLVIKEFKRMKELIVEDDSFGSTRKVTIEKNAILDSVRIGCRCFNQSIRSSKNSVVTIKDCYCLSSFSVEEDSFKNLLKCEFIGTLGLQTISWGSGSFDKCKSLYPRGEYPNEHSPFRDDKIFDGVRICRLKGERGIEINRLEISYLCNT